MKNQHLESSMNRAREQNQDELSKVPAKEEKGLFSKFTYYIKK